MPKSSPRNPKARTSGDSPLTVRIGVSSCLLGELVRWDGGHKRHAFVAEELARRVELVPICPEVGIGLGVPREPIRLERVGDRTQVVGVGDPTGDADVDLGGDLRDYAQRMLHEHPGLHGYLFKSDSPSCGPWRVKVFTPGQPEASSREGVGLFARAIMDARPWLPVEDETCLEDPVLRERFIERVFEQARRMTRDEGTLP